MILPDANLLLYGVNKTSVHQAAAQQWLERSLSGSEPVGFAWSVLTTFVRVSTRSAIFEAPLTVTQALELVEGWLALPTVVTVDPTQRHVAVLRGLLEPLGTAGNLVPDAHLAALAIEHGASVASADHDFGRFSGLRWFDPLAPK